MINLSINVWYICLWIYEKSVYEFMRNLSLINDKSVYEFMINLSMNLW